MGVSLLDRRIKACRYEGNGAGEVAGSLPLVMFQRRPYDQLMGEEEGMSSIGSGVAGVFWPGDRGSSFHGSVLPQIEIPSFFSWPSLPRTVFLCCHGCTLGTSLFVLQCGSLQ